MAPGGLPVNPDTIILARRIHLDFDDGERAEGAARRTRSRAEAPCDALAIWNGRVVAAGRRREMLRLGGRSRHARHPRIVDLGDAVVTPGLIDSHTHFFYWALNRALVIDVIDTPTLEACLDRIRRDGATRRVGEWIVARGFDYNRWGGKPPGARDLDRAVADRPAVVRSRDGHTAWLNTEGLRAAKIGAGRADPPGGRFVRDERGRPTGIVQESAIDELPDAVCAFARRTDAAARRVVDRCVRDAERIARALGIVGVHCMDDEASLWHFQRMRREGKLRTRIIHSLPLAVWERATELGLSSGLGDERLRIGAVKIFADGALGSQTAYMFDAYPGRGAYCGVPVVAGAALREVVVRAAARGWAVWIHAIGDRAVHDAAVAIEAARRVESTALPHRIEHAQCVRPADVRRMARAGIFASVQPCHIPGDIANAQRHWPRAQRHAYPLRQMTDAGVKIAAGSDVPIESIDPRRSLYAAVERMDENGAPAGGWFSESALTMREALWAFTRGAAESVAEAWPAGTLHLGALAEMTVWGADPLEARGAEILKLPIRGVVAE